MKPETKVVADEDRIVWINVVLGALLMVATLPGRTQGLGLITEPMLEELALDRVAYAHLNLWATFLGAAACLPVGWLIDRIGLRPVTVVLLVGLSFCVWRMSAFAGGTALLFIWLFLTRSLGQSGLSVASITAVAKSAGRKNGLAMGVYSALLSILFALAFVVVGALVSDAGWRVAWQGVALGIAVLVIPLTVFFLREPSRHVEVKTHEDDSFTLLAAIRTPLFWVCGGGVAVFGFATSGLGLFNEAVLAEIGFDRETYHSFLAVTTLFALVGQMVCGWLSLRYSMTSLLGIALICYALALGLLPLVRGLATLWMLSGGMGIAAGFITVIFFAVWGQAYGGRELGKIQGVAQGLTVLASALGPLAFATGREMSGSYAPMLYGVAAFALFFAFAAFRVSTPERSPHPDSLSR